MQTLEERQEPGSATGWVPTPLPKAVMAVTNVVVRLLLHSPLHGLASDALMLLTYTGRKSSKRYTIPVSYSRVGDVVTVFTYHRWWKNLRWDAPVAVEIKRQRFEGVAEAITDDQPAIALGLLALLWEHPSIARGYHIPLDAKGLPDPVAVRRVARFVVMVRIQLVSAHGNIPAERPRELARGAHA